MNLGDITVKHFGNETDYIVKFEKRNSNDPDFMPQGYDPLTSQNIEKIRIWLLEGAPE